MKPVHLILILLLFTFACKKENLGDARKLFVESSENLFDYYKTGGSILITDISGERNEMGITYDTSYLYFPALMWQKKSESTGSFAMDLAFSIKRQNVTADVVETKVLITSSLTSFVDTVNIIIYGYTTSNELLNHNVVDAEYCPATKKILYVSDTPDFRCYSYDPLTGASDFIPLTQEPKCISVSADGTRCAIGYDYLVSRLNLTDMTTDKEMKVSGKVRDILITMNGWIYAFPLSGNSEGIHSINLDENIEQVTTSIYYDPSIAKMPASEKCFYTVNSNTPEENQYGSAQLSKFDIRSGFPKLDYDFSAFETDNFSYRYNMLLLSMGGKRILVRDNVLATEGDTLNSLTIHTRLKKMMIPLSVAEFPEADKMLVLNASDNEYVSRFNRIMAYNYKDLNYIGELDNRGINVTVGGSKVFKEIESKYIFSDPDSEILYSISVFKDNPANWIIQQINLQKD